MAYAAQNRPSVEQAMYNIKIYLQKNLTQSSMQLEFNSGHITTYQRTKCAFNSTDIQILRKGEIQSPILPQQNYDNTNCIPGAQFVIFSHPLVPFPFSPFFYIHKSTEFKTPSSVNIWLFSKFTSTSVRKQVIYKKWTEMFTRQVISVFWEETRKTIT